MKKKSGHRRRTKVVRKSRKNLRGTIKRKRLGKGRRRPTRRYSRVQRGGMTPEEVKKLKENADAGDANAQFKMGEIYSKGLVDGYDDAEAIKWYELAAASGHEKAEERLGHIYENGRGVVVDYVKAKKWYELAAKKGNKEALFNLATIYERGLGVEQDKQKAIEYYKRAGPEYEYKIRDVLQSIQTPTS
jgi:hypothetical protein